MIRREQRAAAARADARPDMPPRLQLIESAPVHPDLHEWKTRCPSTTGAPREALPGPATASGPTRWVEPRHGLRDPADGTSTWAADGEPARCSR